MGLVGFLSCLYLGITVLLIFKKNTMGKVYMIFGGLTFLFVMIYPSIPVMPKVLQSFGIFMAFSLMILLFGLMTGILLKIFNKRNKTCIIWSIIMPTILIVILFNVRGYLTYMYIPVLMYMVQGKINNYIDSLNK